MAYLLVCWDSDNSVSVINSSSNALLSRNGSRIKFRWPRQGIFDGTVVNSSDSKREMDQLAKDMAERGNEHGGTEEESQNDTTKRVVPPQKKRKRKLVKHTAKESEELPKEKYHKHNKHDEKAAQIAASRSAAELLFSTQQYRVKEMEDEILKLKQQLKAQESKDCYISTDSEDTSSSPITRKTPGSIEKLKEKPLTKGQKPQEKKRTEIEYPDVNPPPIVSDDYIDGNSTKSSDIHLNAVKEKREKVKIPKVELVKGMGIMVKATSMAAALTRSKRQPTRLMRHLMDELFTEDELRSSSVKGKKSSFPALDADTMNAILCFTQAKADEWGVPVSEESLVRQANNKCYQHRKPRTGN